MRQVDRRVDEGAGANRQTASLAALAVTLLVLVVGLALVRELRQGMAMEDCLLAGRTNCGPALLLH